MNFVRFLEGHSRTILVVMFALSLGGAIAAFSLAVGLFPQVTFPRWARDAPERLVYSSNSSGSWQLWAWDRAVGTRRQVTDHPIGVLHGVVTPDGARVVWFHDDSGDECIANLCHRTDQFDVGRLDAGHLFQPLGKRRIAGCDFHAPDFRQSAQDFPFDAAEQLFVIVGKILLPVFEHVGDAQVP